MAKKKLTKNQRIGRLNKNRGRAFERGVAQFLDWTRVPYSGAMKEWGKADVVDGFYMRNGFWAGECKTQPYDRYLRIEGKWIEQATSATGNRWPVIFSKQYGSTVIYAIMPECSWQFLDKNLHRSGWKVGDIQQFDTITFVQSGGFKVLRADIDKMKTVVGKLQAIDTAWYIMRLSTFKHLINTAGVVVNDARDIQDTP